MGGEDLHVEGMRKLLLVGLLCLAASTAACSGAATGVPSLTQTPSSTTVPRYGIFEQSFTLGGGPYANPWEQVHVALTLTAPSGAHYTVGGFYVSGNTWKVRFAPSELGEWSWQAEIGDGSSNSRQQGRFTVVQSNWPGFVRSNPINPFRWVLDDGAPYYPVGIGDCLVDKNHDGTPLDDMGFDGGFRGPSDPEYGKITDLDTYLGAYAAAGVNLFRFSVDNCAFNLYHRIDPSGNLYLEHEGQWGDELVQKLRLHGFHIYMTIFGFQLPYPNDTSDSAKMAAVERYVKYVVDRYGAYVDVWELMNEYPNPPATIGDGWYLQIGEYLRSVDPYRHPISTSWQRPDLGVIEVTSPHWYQKENEFASDTVTADQIDHWRHFGKPIIFGEQGNSEANWDKRSALRMRLRAWTAFFKEGALIFWNSSGAKGLQGGYASNIYLGPQERAYLKVLGDFTAGFDARARLTAPTVSNPALVRGYALRSPTSYVAYLHAYTNHSSAATGVSVMVDVPANGTAKWIDPSTGTVLGTQAVSAGAQTLSAPAFTTDVALKIG
jgi:hypothetical protein